MTKVVIISAFAACALLLGQAAKPKDESARFPTKNRVETKVVDRELMGKKFMPGGTIARYKTPKGEYTMFVAQARSAADAPLVLLDWKKAMPDAKLVPSFGGYFGKDGAIPVFVFTKGPWIVGVAGLPQAQADAEARTLAARLY
jgi:hypothetical protein